MAAPEGYNLVPATSDKPTFVAEIRGINLKNNIADELIQRIREDVTKYRILVFKDQGIVPPERQIEITQWFGEVEDAGFEQHVKSPSRLILRVSNDDTEGFRDFGTAGFHIDGSFMKNPNAYSIYHIVTCPKFGSTVFVPLNEVLTGIGFEQKARWERLWILKFFDRIRGFRDHPGHVIHPLVYRHPLSGLETMCIHQGKTSRFVWDKRCTDERKTNKGETKDLLEEIDSTIKRDGGTLLYHHQWEPGDFIISDNLAVAHLATPETQLTREQIGLRVMHRTTVKGMYRPRKDRTHDTDSNTIKKKDSNKCTIQ